MTPCRLVSGLLNTPYCVATLEDNDRKAPERVLSIHRAFNICVN